MSDDAEIKALRARVTELEADIESMRMTISAQMLLNEAVHRNIRMQMILSLVQTACFAALAVAVALLPKVIS